MAFKPGDIVVCCSKHPSLTLGREYTVENVNAGNGYVKVTGVAYFLRPQRFKLKEDVSFKKGDVVVCIHDHPLLTVGKEYTIEYVEPGSGYVQVSGHIGVFWPHRFRIKTHLPLYSEETAKSFLEERGYKVEPPPAPETGKAYIYRYAGGRIEVLTSPVMKNLHYYKLLAVVDWTEGQGVPLNKGD